MTQLDGEVWRFTGVYGNPKKSRRRHTWELLRDQFRIPWFCCGNFNAVLSMNEKTGGRIKVITLLWPIQTFGKLGFMLPARKIAKILIYAGPSLPQEKHLMSMTTFGYLHKLITSPLLNVVEGQSLDRHTYKEVYCNLKLLEHSAQHQWQQALSSLMNMEFPM